MAVERKPSDALRALAASALTRIRAGAADAAADRTVQQAPKLDFKSLMAGGPWHQTAGDPEYPESVGSGCRSARRRTKVEG